MKCSDYLEFTIRYLENLDDSACKNVTTEATNELFTLDFFSTVPKMTLILWHQSFCGSAFIVTEATVCS